MATAVSFMRLEKPHSLSYHETTRISLPATICVRLLSKFELCASWLKSMETSFFSTNCKMPFIGPSAACFMAAWISSIEVSRTGTNFRSTTETFGVGTRIAAPSSLPASCGSTRPTALAAPVEVGIMERAAARARYISP